MDDEGCNVMLYKVASEASEKLFDPILIIESSPPPHTWKQNALIGIVLSVS